MTTPKDWARPSYEQLQKQRAINRTRPFLQTGGECDWCAAASTMHQAHCRRCGDERPMGVFLEVGREDWYYEVSPYVWVTL